MDKENLVKTIDEIQQTISHWENGKYPPAILRDTILRQLQKLYRDLLLMPTSSHTRTVCEIDRGELSDEAEKMADNQTQPSSSVEFLQERPTECIEAEARGEQIPFCHQNLGITRAEKQRESTSDTENSVSDNQTPIQEADCVGERPTVIFGRKISTEQKEQFIEELFDGDEQFFYDEVAVLTALDNLESALFHINESHGWRANDSTAEEFTALLIEYNFER